MSFPGCYVLAILKWIIPAYRVLYGGVALFFGVAGASLIVFAVSRLVRSASGGEPAAAIEGIGLLAVALVALEISQTIVEEEVIRQAHVSAPTRVRRYLSRFLVVVVIALGAAARRRRRLSGCGAARGLGCVRLVQPFG
jgi:hypothetical protein